ncbi:hypothetical protein ABEB36_007856 [Hypothenemus hampei]|uniref:ZAD domain-containing protein n=1 Tax=Hypothenemus hampei TaxID=57062 RepID=A0ABD1EYG6_HYPHA
MSQICRLCLKRYPLLRNHKFFSIDYRNSNGISISSIMKTFIPEMYLGLSENPVICSSCHKALENAYSFRMQCLRSENLIGIYMRETHYTKPTINLQAVVDYWAEIYRRQRRHTEVAKANLAEWFGLVGDVLEEKSVDIVQENNDATLFHNFEENFEKLKKDIASVKEQLNILRTNNQHDNTKKSLEKEISSQMLDFTQLQIVDITSQMNDERKYILVPKTPLDINKGIGKECQSQEIPTKFNDTSQNVKNIHPTGRTLVTDKGGRTFPVKVVKINNQKELNKLIFAPINATNQESVLRGRLPYDTSPDIQTQKENLTNKGNLPNKPIQASQPINPQDLLNYELQSPSRNEEISQKISSKNKQNDEKRPLSKDFVDLTIDEPTKKMKMKEFNNSLGSNCTESSCQKSYDSAEKSNYLCPTESVLQLIDNVPIDEVEYDLPEYVEVNNLSIDDLNKMFDTNEVATEDYRQDIKDGDSLDDRTTNQRVPAEYRAKSLSNLEKYPDVFATTKTISMEGDYLNDHDYLISPYEINKLRIYKNCRGSRYLCTLCGEFHPSNKHLQHMKSHDTHCLVCKVNFGNVFVLNLHALKHNFFCNVCGEDVPYSKYSKHEYLHHQTEICLKRAQQIGEIQKSKLTQFAAEMGRELQIDNRKAPRRKYTSLIENLNKKNTDIVKKEPVEKKKRKSSLKKTANAAESSGNQQIKKKSQSRVQKKIVLSETRTDKVREKITVRRSRRLTK